MKSLGTVLIADDMPVARHTLQALLQRDGYTLAFAENGLQTLEQAARINPDLILLDVMMPDLDGFETCRRLRADPYLAEVPVIMVTALDDRESRLQGLEAGADDFVTKPYDPVELRARVRTTLRLNRYRLLLRERTRFQQSVELSPDGIIMVDPDYVIQLINRSALKLWGHTASQTLLGKPFLDFVPSDQRERWRAYLDRLFAGQATDPYMESYFLRIDGEKTPVDISAGRLDMQGESLAQIIVRDITERIRQETRLRILSRTVEQSPSIVVITDAEGRIEYVNAKFVEVTGYTGEEVVGQSPRLLKSGVLDAEWYRQLWETIKAGQRWHGEFRNRKKTGELYWEYASIIPIRSPDGAIAHYTKVAEDVSERKLLMLHLEQLAHYDPLTGLPNRSLLGDRLQSAISLARHSGNRIGLLQIDLDNYTAINTTWGQKFGDLLLQVVANRLRLVVQGDRTLGRSGGDEFTLLIPDLARVTEAADLGQRILKLFAEPFVLEEQNVYLTASVGIAVYPEDAPEGNDLLGCADTATRRAKELGKNGFQFFTAELNARIRERWQTESDIRRALEQHEFVLHYQPRINLATGVITSLEALVRWQHPDRGLISPGLFIPVAEQSGLIVPLGQQVLNIALGQAQRWQNECRPPLPIAVNLSPLQLHQENIVQQMNHLLDRFGLSSDWLELEVTETAVIQNMADAIIKLSQLRARGITLAMDDFGTGYASLSYLKQLPLHSLKIDQSFIRDIKDSDSPDSPNIAIVQAIIALAKSLRLRVVAEGVETVHQARLLADLGCDEAQGYLYCRPQPAAALEPLLQAGVIDRAGLEPNG